VILAIDPGTSKLGWAVVSDDGQPQAQGIWAAGNWEAGLARLDGLELIRTVVLGDGTNRMNIEQGLKRLLPEARMAVVDEKESTVEAWKLKRTEEAGPHPWKALNFMLMQLFQPVPVDDFAARVLAKRYLSGGGAKGGSRSSAG
jgi:hypothetical protein